MGPLELWGGVECTVNRVGTRWFDTSTTITPSLDPCHRMLPSTRPYASVANDVAARTGLSIGSPASTAFMIAIRPCCGSMPF